MHYFDYKFMVELFFYLKFIKQKVDRKQYSLFLHTFYCLFCTKNTFSITCEIIASYLFWMYVNVFLIRGHY
jgi:hypothetical protein